MNIRPYRQIERRKSKKIKLGNIFVGGDSPISVQTMTNTLTTDINATLEQIQISAEAGADIVRVSCPDKNSTTDHPHVCADDNIVLRYISANPE